MDGSFNMSLGLTAVVDNGSALFSGFLLTCLSTAIALAVGLVGAPALHLLRSSGFSPAEWMVTGYISFFRTTPEMVLIFWAYFCLPIAIGWQVSGLAAGSVTLGLVAAAYLAEILRAGIESVPKGQFEAARSLGLCAFSMWAKVVLPQAMPVMMGPFVNYLTELIKNTTLLAAVGVGELAFVAYTLGSQTYRYFEFISAIGVCYFVLIFPISMLGHFLEWRRARVTQG
jgi:His/Glu/Gln/Arg/opine family amino acid ABC transporter permease subunit